MAGLDKGLHVSFLGSGDTSVRICRLALDARKGQELDGGAAESASHAHTIPTKESDLALDIPLTTGLELYAL